MNGRMFNTLFDHLFLCQSPLKERRRPPTGGLREAFKESMGGGVSTPSSPCVRLKRTFGASATRFSPTWGKTMVTAWNGLTLTWVFPVGVSWL